MYPGVSKGLLYFKCQNKDCTRKKKSARARILIDFLEEFFKDGLNFTEKQYEKYREGISSLSQVKRQQLQEDLHSKQGALKALKRLVDEKSLQILNYETKALTDSKTDKRILDVNKQSLEDLINQQDKLEEDIVSIRNKLSTPESTELSSEQFFNLSKNALDKVKAGSALEKDIICRFVFFNFYIDDEKVASFSLKEPFETLLKERFVLISRGDMTRTCDLMVPNHALYQLSYAPIRIVYEIFELKKRL